MSQPYPMPDFLAKIIEFLRPLAINLYIRKLNHRLKEDGSDVTDVDMTYMKLFEKAFGHLKLKLVIEENEWLVNDGTSTLLIFDPIDGTHALTRGQNTPSVGITYMQNAVPLVSVAASLGIVAHYRAKDGEFTGFNYPRMSQGTMLQASEAGNFLSPLMVHNRGEFTPIKVPRIEEPRPLTTSSTLLLHPCIDAISSINHGIYATGCESNIAAQMQVIFRQAEACLVGSRYTRSAKASLTNPGSKLWDLIPKAVDNAGLVFVTLTGENRHRIVPIEELLSLCNEKYELTEQLLICHPKHCEGLLEICSGILA